MKKIYTRIIYKKKKNCKFRYNKVRLIGGWKYLTRYRLSNRILLLDILHSIKLFLAELLRNFFFGWKIKKNFLFNVLTIVKYPSKTIVTPTRFLQSKNLLTEKLK